MSEWTLERAIVVASRAHQGQVDHNDDPYILHPLRVMSRVQNHANGHDLGHARMAAVLHDVIEDTAYELEDLREDGCPEPVLEAVALLTHDQDEPYMDYVHRVLDNPIALAVKRADVEDNGDPARLGRMRDTKLRERLTYKYANARLALGMD